MSLIQAFVAQIPVQNLSWDVVLDASMQQVSQELQAMVSAKAWARFVLVKLIACGSFLASWWGCGTVCFFGLLWLHFSQKARQSLQFFGQASWTIISPPLCLVGRCLFSPVKLCIKHTEWMWDWNFQIID